MTTSNLYTYQPDILGEDYQQLTLNFADDYDGKVVATLVRKKATEATKKAVLYIHGFADYFFQKEMAEQFNQHGYDFYALDLRKYGRSKLPHQKLYYVLDLREYDAEISKALEVISQENHNQVVLAGHSTGGLIATLYAAHYPDHRLIKAVWNNSPFYDFYKSVIEKKVGIPLLSEVGKRLPNAKFPSGLNPWYTPSLHKDFYGEWDFNLDWKPKTMPFVHLSFVTAIHEAQKEIHQGVTLNVPTLIMHSHQSKFPKKWGIDAQQSDVILDVNDMTQNAKKMKGDVQTLSIQNGLHDLVLSAPPVRAQVYKDLFAWLTEKIQ
ncbi:MULTISPECIES: alpha/beta hydrolase [Acinetobacter]|uniref:alpha/beta hydrolase n=1 Tax=Acinetobacter TaxID=469 RepID=UPI00051BD6B8|nr:MULTISPECIES: alpha/beta hydrolase [Acinetobacter]MCH7294834.1 alpha/beta hydrolase [Acinetobacter higginsii]MCH7379144.1 alpha/beta hydrolase [Acinetobacter higginsii]MCJ0828049.1 alpha/beta hydrolase [Acinetobacter sp. NIPH1876]MDO3666560.1 alpha/beta hydrolase [Acinetobacter higginsii]